LVGYLSRYQKKGCLRRNSRANQAWCIVVDE
jgi:hypothetical protein